MNERRKTIMTQARFIGIDLINIGECLRDLPVVGQATLTVNKLHALADELSRLQIQFREAGREVEP